MKITDLVDASAEAGVIATLIYHPDFLLIDNNLQPRFFYGGENQILFWAISKLVESGVTNIVCMQPFACLPNHVTGKGVIGELRRRNPESNIIAVDYDPGASEVNQINRIKLMLTAALKKIKNKDRLAVPEAEVKDEYSELIGNKAV